METAVETTTPHRSRDGLYYSTYTEMVEANIRHRDKILKSKGLDQSSFQKAMHGAAKKKKPSIKKRVRAVVTPQQQPRRRSSLRIRKTPPTNNGLQFDENDEILMPRRVIAEEPPPKKRGKKKKVGTEIKALTTEERRLLSQAKGAKDNDQLLNDMDTYLKEQEELSHQNHRSVMRQVEKLVAGDGITYHHWEEGVYFYKNQRVNILSSDFRALYDEACDFEDEHGKDLGNGWLLRHPIKKLANFQQYYLAQQQQLKG